MDESSTLDNYLISSGINLSADIIKNLFIQYVYQELENCDIIYVKCDSPLNINQLNCGRIYMPLLPYFDNSIHARNSYFYKNKIIDDIKQLAYSFARELIFKANELNKCILFYSFASKIDAMASAYASDSTCIRLVIAPDYLFVDKSHHCITPPIAYPLSIKNNSI